MSTINDQEEEALQPADFNPILFEFWASLALLVMGGVRVRQLPSVLLPTPDSYNMVMDFWKAHGGQPL